MLWLIQLLFEIYLVIVCLCVMLRSSGADYHNPIIQVLVKLTNPVLKPLRSAIPDIKRFDTGGFVGAVIIKLIELIIVFVMTNTNLAILGMVIVSIILVLKLMVNIWFYALIIQALLSWFQPSDTPLLRALLSLNRPVLSLFQHFIPPLGGIDITPLIAMIVLQIISFVILNPIMGIGISMINS